MIAKKSLVSKSIFAGMLLSMLGCGIDTKNEAIEPGLVSLDDDPAADGDRATIDGFELDDSTLRDDIDRDGISDSRDNCPTIANTNQSNVDGDTLGDACDDDIDGDGFLNAGDNCSLVENSDQANLDNDTMGDACDDDKDGDGTSNLDDNCPLIVNADQANLDSDAVGDACDDDVDGDGKLNANDNCPLIENGGQDDNDGDGVGNLCDFCPSLATDDNLDSDGDGVGDECDSEVIVDSERLLVPVGALYRLSGSHCFSGNVSIYGQLNVTRYQSDLSGTGTVRVSADNINVAMSGDVNASSAGYPGGRPSSSINVGMDLGGLVAEEIELVRAEQVQATVDMEANPITRGLLRNVTSVLSQQLIIAALKLESSSELEMARIRQWDQVAELGETQGIVQTMAVSAVAEEGRSR